MNKKRVKIPLVIRWVRWIFPKLEYWIPSLAHRYFIKIFFTPLRYQPTEKEQEAAARSHQYQLTISEEKIHVYSWGSATPYLLFTHGWAGRGTQFRKFIDPVTQAGYRVIAFDGPAHGKSSGKRANLLLFEAVIQAIVAKEGLPVALVSHSFGGGVALMSVMNGLPVTRIVNIASPTEADKIIDSYLAVIGGLEGTKRAFKDYIQRTFDRPFHEFTAMYFAGRLPASVQVLLIHDTEDKDVTIDQPRALVKAYPEVKMIETTGLGHNRILKDDGIIRSVLDFVTAPEK